MAVILDNLLVGGIRYILERIANMVDGEMNDEGSLREELLATQMRFELGEIEEEEMAAIESEIMARLREIRASRGEETGLTSGARVVGVDVTFNGSGDGDE